MAPGHRLQPVMEARGLGQQRATSLLDSRSPGLPGRGAPKTEAVMKALTERPEFSTRARNSLRSSSGGR